MEFGVLFTSHPNPRKSLTHTATCTPAPRTRSSRPSGWATTPRGSPSITSPPATASCRTASPTWPISRPGPAASSSAPGVITLPLYDPIRVVENANFVDILSNGRVMLGIGSGYRPYEFEGLGKDFDGRRDMVEEAVGLMFERLPSPSLRPQGQVFQRHRGRRLRDAAASHPDAASAALHGGRHRPLDRLLRAQRLRPDAVDLAQHRDAGGADRALQARARHRQRPSGARIRRPARSTSRAGSISPTPTSRRAPTPSRRSCATSPISAARAPAAISARCRRRAAQINYDDLLATHAAARLGRDGDRPPARMQARTGMTSLLLHYPPYYGREKAMRSLKLFAERVIPAFRPPARQVAAAE